jgi:hypothetical protein
MKILNKIMNDKGGAVFLQNQQLPHEKFTQKLSKNEDYEDSRGIPFKKQGYGSQENSSRSLSIEDKHICVHACIECSFGKQEHASVYRLNSQNS